MAIIIDKRLLPKNNTTNSRQKFIDRYKGAIKQRIQDIIRDNSIKDFNKSSKKVKIKIDDLDQPHFELEPGTGNQDRIYIGNKRFKKGDKVYKPQYGEGDKRAGRGGKTQDDFEFNLTEKEFLDLFFEDLALPHLLNKQFIGSSFEIKHSGFSRYGGPSSLNIKKTMLNALGRRNALKRKRQEVRSDLLSQCDGCIAGYPIKNGIHQAPYSSASLTCRVNKYRKIQYIEDIDLRYNFKDKVDVPTTRAVMFCCMDVSGSMGDTEKDIAKRFFILLNLFLKRNYNIVDIVFVRHTDTSEEVDEKTFFYDRESGGTIISSAYRKINEIIYQRYNLEQWNVYIAQASDGDNFETDNEEMSQLLINKLLPITQYFAYIDIGDHQVKSDVLKIMEQKMKTYKNLQARNVADYKDIYPVFRSLI